MIYHLNAEVCLEHRINLPERTDSCINKFPCRSLQKSLFLSMLKGAWLLLLVALPPVPFNGDTGNILGGNNGKEVQTHVFGTFFFVQEHSSNRENSEQPSTSPQPDLPGTKRGPDCNSCFQCICSVSPLEGIALYAVKSLLTYGDPMN